MNEIDKINNKDIKNNKYNKNNKNIIKIKVKPRLYK